MTVQAASDASGQTPIRVPPRYWWFNRIVLSAVLVLTGLAGLRWWWGFEAHRRLQTEIARYRAMGQPVLPEDFVREPIPNEENGAYWLMKAADELEMTLIPQDWEFELNAWSYTASERVIKESKLSLDFMAHARVCEKVDWGIPILPFSEYRSGAYPSSRDVVQAQLALTRFLVVNFQHQLRKNELIDALSVLEDGIHQAHLIMSCNDRSAVRDAQWFQCLWLDKLSEHGMDFQIAIQESISKEASLLRSRIIALQNKLVDSHLWVRYTKQILLCERAQFLAESLRFPRVGLGSWRPDKSTLTYIQWFTWPDEVIAFSIGFPKWGEASIMAERGSAIGFSEDSHLIVDWPMHPINSYGLGAFGGDARDTLFYARRNLAIRRSAAIAIAVWCFVADHGHLPDELSMLVPDYLAEIPVDPVASDPSVRLRLVNDRWGPRITNAEDDDYPMGTSGFWLYGKPLMMDAILEEESINSKARNSDAYDDGSYYYEDEDRHDEPE